MSSFALPDLLVTIDFTPLQIASESLTDTRLRTVSIFVGLTNNTDDVVADTMPVPLVPGLHLYGRVTREIRAQFGKPSLASFGLFTVSDAEL